MCPSHLYGDSVITAINYGGIVQLSIHFVNTSTEFTNTVALKFSEGADIMSVKTLLTSSKSDGEMKIECTTKGFSEPNSAFISKTQAVECIDTCSKWEVKALDVIDFDWSMSQIFLEIDTWCRLEDFLIRLLSTKTTFSNASMNLTLGTYGKEAKWCAVCTIRRSSDRICFTA